MLNKNICIKCINDSFVYNKWSYMDEKRWEKETVLCPVLSVNGLTNQKCIIDNPPKWCHYILEHIMEENDVK